jgi:hypothetical protein
VANGAFFGAQIVLSVVISHYDGIDLHPSVKASLLADRMRKLTPLREEVTPTAQSLAHLLSLEAVHKRWMRARSSTAFSLSFFLNVRPMSDISRIILWQ